ncbi:TrmH family RNA methyltransferase [Microbacterium sp. SLBN-154]|uniref:TrmH family RNA methyltransferase n=1 Tax=Microbacterium sp. SLBN-154 TaxID=2768458 RepID=UPI001F3000FE|nr:TrmH family RNA methyltransferase [Microbacterium sp. SLBN-154]
MRQTVITISRPNARFQQWEALLHSRNKRHRAGEFLVHGVRPITLALEHGWPVRAVLYDRETSPSGWATSVLERAGGEVVAMSRELLGRLSERDDVPEVLVVAELPSDDLSRIEVGPAFLAVVFDRPIMPGNIGSLLRSVDAFGGAGLIVTGHAADPYDPAAVRASTGSVFTVPVVRVASHEAVMRWVRERRGSGCPITVIGTDEHADVDVADVDLAEPALLVVGNETRGMSRGWRENCDVLARIPMGGAASSLNAASAATVALYEAVRQRGRK